MIGINGQYLVMFKVNNMKDFIREDQLVSFKFIEEAGNVLPIFELIFETSDDSIIQYLNSGNTLEVSMGISKTSMITTKLYIFKRDKDSVSNISTRIYLNGFLSATPYNYTCSNNIIKGSSKDAIKTVASKNFKFKTNIDKTDDTMSWIQPNTSNREFVTSVWLHSFISNDDLTVIGITSNSELIFNSMKNSFQSRTPTWKFQDTVSDGSNNIIYNGTPTFIGNIGLNNHLTGFYKSRVIHDLDKVESKLSTSKIAPILARTKKQDTSDMGSRMGTVSLKTANMHDNYHNAYDMNVTKLNALKSLKAKVDIYNQYFPIKVLDTVLLKDNSGNIKNTTSEDSSGFWIVSKIARILSNRQFINVVTLCRDGINNLQ